MIPWVAAEVKTQYDMAVSYSVSDSYVFKDNVDTITQFRPGKPRFCPGITLQSTCRDALCCSWVNTEVKRAVDDPLPPTLIFGELLECWPYTRLRGFGLSYSDLFCFMGSAWLNGDAMRAFNKILARFKNNKTIMIPPSAKNTGGGGAAVRDMAKIPDQT
ncbi:hypothetical protein GQ600_12848 [Phytophthora cactorum]|nr:hypothetical protein GQ600_12848 [Phytophthora cactorum]